GAFHPKLLVIAGDDYASVAVGSGNATLPGWHDNAELWTVLRGDNQEAPAVFAELAAWLRRLPKYVRFSAGIPEVLGRVAERLDSLPPTLEGPRLVSTADGPLLDQLPTGRVEELLVAAPFYERDAAALRGLCDRFEPERLYVALQPRDAVLGGSALASLLEERNGIARTIASDRYHHGKLVEWSDALGRFALTGSPNLSRSA